MSARTARTALTALAAIFLIAAEAPETRLEEYQRLRREGAAAAQAGDLAKAETALAEALKLYPDVPGSYIRLARVQAAAGRTEAATANLATYAAMGLWLDLSRDPALQALADQPEFAPVMARLKLNSQPGQETFAWARLEPGGGVFEGIVGYEKGFLVSSVASRTLLKVSGQGEVESFLAPDDETGGLFGMAVDRSADTLWVAESRGAGIPGSAGEARTGLLKVSLSKRKVVKRFLLPQDGVKRQLGDVMIDRDGTVYASDSVGAGIYRLKPGAPKLELFVQSRNMASPQGMAICPDAGAMVVADYSTGLHRIDLRTGEETLVGGLMMGLAGTDGLLRVDYTFEGGVTGRGERKPMPMDLVVTQNGVSPERVLYLHLSGDCRTVEGASVLTQGQRDITLAAQASGVIGFIGSSGWAAYDGDGKPTTETPAPAMLFVVDIPQR